MLLMLEKWGPIQHHFLELAMILDITPIYNFDPRCQGEPWHSDSGLTAACRSADLEGYAWLNMAFFNDPPATWGSKQVRFQADGKIMRPEIVKGVRTGRLVKLRYEVIARHIFRNLGGVDTVQPYKVVLQAHITRNIDVQRKYRRPHPPRKDPLLGFPVENCKDFVKSQPASHPTLADEERGCLCTWVDHNGNTETWFVYADLKTFDEYRFYLTEFQRRPFVQIVMEQLGFVKGKHNPTFQNVCSGHLQTIANSMSALYEIDCTRRFVRQELECTMNGGASSNLGSHGSSEAGRSAEISEDI